MEEKKTIDLRPLGKWKRILLSLGDYAICFILSFVLFNLAVFPIAKITIHAQDRYNETVVLEKESNSLLLDNKIIFARHDNNDTFQEDVLFTFEVFLSYYAFDEIDINGARYNQYGHKEENDTIRHYYLDYLHDEQGYLSAFRSVNELDDYFSIGDDINSIYLRNDYKSLLSSELLEVEGDDHSILYTNFRDHIFARLFYVYVYEDILANDFVVGGISYLTKMNEIKAINDYLNWSVTNSALISTFISWLVIYLIFPLISKDKKTPAMMMMRINKLNFKNLNYIDNKDVIFTSIYHLALSLSFMIFLPSIYFGLSYCFALPLLFALGIISILLALVSLFVILFNQYNRSGSDILSQAIMISSVDLDEMYRIKNEE